MHEQNNHEYSHTGDLTQEETAATVITGSIEQLKNFLLKNQSYDAMERTMKSLVLAIPAPEFEAIRERLKANQENTAGATISTWSQWMEWFNTSGVPTIHKVKDALLNVARLRYPNRPRIGLMLEEEFVQTVIKIAQSQEKNR
ncbi:MAG: hypothetical protein ABI758_01850 [Candidatus Woesebacteria bacterium]